MLVFAQRLAKLSPGIVLGADAPRRTEDTEAIRSFNRKLAGEGMVLLKNDGLLPLAPNLRIAVIGPVRATAIHSYTKNC